MENGALVAVVLFVLKRSKYCNWSVQMKQDNLIDPGERHMETLQIDHEE